MPQPVKFNPNSETEKGARPPRALFSAPRGKPWIVQKSSRPAGWMTSCEVRDARRVPLRPWRACSPTSEFGLNLISTRTGSCLSCMPIKTPGHASNFECGRIRPVLQRPHHCRVRQRDLERRTIFDRITMNDIKRIVEVRLTQGHHYYLFLVDGMPTRSGSLLTAAAGRA